MPGFSWLDKVKAIECGLSNATQDIDVTVSDFRDAINKPTWGMQRLFYHKTFDLTDLNSTEKDLGIHLPVGSIMRAVALRITTLIVAGGTTVKVGIGIDPSGTVNDNVGKYGYLSGLTAGLEFSTLFNVVTPIALAEDLYLTGLTTAGSALGNSNITLGAIECAVVFDAPVYLSTGDI